MAVLDILKDVPDDLTSSLSSFSDDGYSSSDSPPLCVPQDRIEDIELYSMFLDGFNLYPECDTTDRRQDQNVEVEVGEEEAKSVLPPLKRIWDGFYNRRQRSKREVVNGKRGGWWSSINGVSFSLEETEKSDDNGKRRRNCSHCETRETPQWRMGPNGPKTLCNACGVRYKSGRLSPEYRPGASPTFYCRTHSNFHKKIMKKRSNFIY